MSALQSVAGQLNGDASTRPEASQAWIAVGDLQISMWNQTVQRSCQPINLTPTEFRMLACLAQQARQVMTYQQMVQCAQGYEASGLEAAELVKPHMYHLRQKLEPDPSNPRYILTVRGTGYLLAAEVEAAP